MNFIKSELKRLAIEKNLSELLKVEEAAKHSLEWGMNYIFFSPSKRVRPLLTLETNLIFSEPDRDSYLLAAAVELIHTYSLVHDDLPCMDDDEMRRGIPTLHTVVDEPYSLLVGDALLTRAFGILATYSKIDKLPQIIERISSRGGYQGMIKGQFLDMNGEGQQLAREEIDEINRLKTSALLQLSMELGAINGGADSDELSLISELGELIGQIFQLQDDILDIVGDQKELGKSVGSDEKNAKSSIPLILGLDRARELMNSYKLKAEELTAELKGNRTFFNKLLEFLVVRTK